MKIVFLVGEAAFNANQSSAASCHASFLDVAAFIALLHFHRSLVEISDLPYQILVTLTRSLGP